jgi:hypothetical protein
LDESGEPSPVPKIVTMPAVTGDECEESNSRFVYEKIISNRTFCAGKRDGEVFKVIFISSKQNANKLNINVLLIFN